MDNKLNEIIKSTIYYYDQLDYPLTVFEIWKHLTNIETDNDLESSGAENYSLMDILNSLESGKLKKAIGSQMGFYFTRGRDSLVQKRLQKNKISCLKLKKLKELAWIMRLFPFARMISITGRLAMKNANSTSDWDLFVAIKKGRIWTGRTAMTAILHLIGKRRHGKKIKNRVCLNYFISDGKMKIGIENRPCSINLFSASEYSFMIPLFGFKKFKKLQLNNLWIRNYKPNYSVNEVKGGIVVPDSHFSKVLRKTFERTIGFEFIEKFLEKLEKEKIARNPNTHLEGSIIEANENNLVFLPVPQGKEIYERTIAKLENIL